VHKIAKLAIVATLGVSGAAFAADGVSHSFVEAGYGYRELGGGALTDGHGFRIAASYELPANLIVDASFDRNKYDGGDAKVSELSAGLKYKLPLTGNADLLLGASYERLDYNFTGDEFDGFNLNLGARARLTDKLQAEASVKYVDAEEVPSSFAVSLGGRYHFTPAFSAGIDVVKQDVLMYGDTRFTAMFRYSFGAR
jgi:hypothetical protein